MSNHYSFSSDTKMKDKPLRAPKLRPQRVEESFKYGNVQPGQRRSVQRRECTGWPACQQSFFFLWKWKRRSMKSINRELPLKLWFWFSMQPVPWHVDQLKGILKLSDLWHINTQIRTLVEPYDGPVVNKHDRSISVPLKIVFGCPHKFLIPTAAFFPLFFQ